MKTQIKFTYISDEKAERREAFNFTTAHIWKSAARKAEKLSHLLHSQLARKSTIEIVTTCGNIKTVEYYRFNHKFNTFRLVQAFDQTKFRSAA